MCVVSVQFNALLAVFNMIPLPPLDGGRIAVGLLPPRASMALASVERYGMLIVIVLLMFGPLGIIWRFVQAITSFMLGGNPSLREGERRCADGFFERHAAERQAAPRALYRGAGELKKLQEENDCFFFAADWQP
jgi:hypothetical protein